MTGGVPTLAGVVTFLDALYSAVGGSILLDWIPDKERPVNGSHLGSIVVVHVEIRADATTAESLGATREGVGVVIDDAGLVVTIGYLVIEARSITLRTNTGRLVQARFVGYDQESGFGLLRAVEWVPEHPIQLGASTDIAVGDEVTIAAVYEEGAAALQPATVVSLASFTGYWEYWLPRALYVSPPHPAFGGAGLLDRNGMLIGIGSILTRLQISGHGTIPANMFVPIEFLRAILTELQTAGRPSDPPRPWLGMTYQEADDGGILVVRVSSEGPAEQAGLRPGDVIAEVAGEPPGSLADFYQKVWSQGQAGVEIPLTVVRSGAERTIRVLSGNRYDHLRLGLDDR